MRLWVRCGMLPALVCLVVGGCKKTQPAGSIPPASVPGINADGTTDAKLLLDWRPEPEFGGFYAANLGGGAFSRHKLNVDIKSGGEGAPTWQLLAARQADFATTAADQVLLARSQGADVIAIFAAYQTFPQGVMVHKARNFHTLRDVFASPGTLAAEKDMWLTYCTTQFAPAAVKVTGFGGGVEAFLARPDYSQQCFVTSEPLLAAQKGGDPQTFLIADAGYNPYATVVITRGEIARVRPDLVKAMADSCREGWRAYLDDPSAANAAMGKLNREMDAGTFAAAAAAQKPLIETDATTSAGLGSMTQERWDQLRRQLIDLKALDATKAAVAGTCFVNP